MHDDDFDTGSDPCFAHHLVDGHVVDPQTARDVGVFRKAERQRLYKSRKNVPLEERQASSASLAGILDGILGDVTGLSIAVYWPIRGELDLRDWLRDCHNRGARMSLPVVVQKARPVEFHHWTPNDKMRLGTWNIPVPESGKQMTPDVIIIPLLGCDEKRFRLGNGGGYYDRTLAARTSRPRTIGVGHPHCMMKTIFPMPWDIPMDKIALSDGTVF